MKNKNTFSSLPTYGQMEAGILKPEGYRSPEEEYPELDKIAYDIERLCIDAINIRRQHVKTECPYPGQCILEILISKLERDV